VLKALEAIGLPQNSIKIFKDVQIIIILEEALFLK
jgi:hypothetical protein